MEWLTKIFEWFINLWQWRSPGLPARNPINAHYLGLKTVFCPSEDEDSPEISHDIVAVHGIGADPYFSWYTKGIHWLENEKMLPSKFPSARIMTFGYESNWFGEDAVRIDLDSVADNLLEELIDARKVRKELIGCPDRPIVFIGHCFGGLVIQKVNPQFSRAYAVADFEPQALLTTRLQLMGTDDGIYDQTSGILFLGTPFRGTGFITAQVLQEVAVDANCEVQPSVLRHLHGEDSTLNSTVRQFTMLCKQQANKIRIEFCVNKSSGCLDGYRDFQLHLNHFNLNKFSSPNNDSFQKVVRHLQYLSSNPIEPKKNPVPEKFFYVPRPRNANFQARQAELDHLSKRLLGSGNLQKFCVILGMPGMGKTELATQFCYLNDQHFSFIFWLDAESESSLATSFAQIASNLSLVKEDQIDQQRNIEVAKRWLIGHPGWLMVFDNVEADTINLVKSKYRPTCPHGSILLTSQHHSTGFGQQSPVQLDSLTEDEGSSLLLATLSGSEKEFDSHKRDLAKLISKKVGGLPLLIEHLAGYIFESGVTLDRTLTDLKTYQTNHMLSHDSRSGKSPLAMQTVFDLALRDLDPNARLAINTMAMLSDCIPEVILNDLLLNPGMEGANWNPDETRRSLTARHLVRSVGSQSGDENIEYRIHRSLQLYLLNSLHNDIKGLQTSFNHAVAILYRAFPKRSHLMVPLPESWGTCEQFLLHVIALHNVYVQKSPPLKPTKDFVEVLCNAGAFLYERSLTDTGFEILETAKKACEILPRGGPQNTSMCLQDHVHNEEDLNTTGFQILKNADELCKIIPRTFSDDILVSPNPQPQPKFTSLTSLEADILAYMAGIQWKSGSIRGRKQGRDLGNKVIKLRQRRITECPADESSPIDYILLANAYNDFGLQLLNEGLYENAKPYHELSLLIKQKLKNVIHVPHFEFASSKICLAYVLLAQGKNIEAVNCAKEAVGHARQDRQNSTAIHPFEFDLAVILFNANRFWESMGIHALVLENRINILGEENEDTLLSYFAAASCYYQDGSFSLALEYVDKCLSKSDIVQWTPECVLRAKYLKSLILQGSGKSAEAERYRTESIQKRNIILAEHAEHKWREPQPKVDDMVYFDYLVNLNAGRTTISAKNGSMLREPTELARNIRVMSRMQKADTKTW
ncbi:hypothetical protein N7462_007529 [Penicillium macrosclerotiorum]|uniref:uncharacterized protein n=1 Tax=Penicillium macrosclerotiorum TaxID=303699 RepID=UPI00254732BD|nr:uncharacterized protein N7462_007529 [Penicillium macrosclerotiorum]KAJ5679285.1 hypothetical protein N7462_007529 [Penicillium macrosclerotiorum]